LYAVQSSQPVERVVFGRSGGVVILGANLVVVQAAIDAQRGDSLDESDNYRQIIGDLPGGRAVTVYTTGSGVRDLISQASSASPVPLNLDQLSLSNFASSAFALSVVEAGLQVDIVSYLDLDQLTTTQKAMLDAAGQSSKAAELYPDQTVAFLTGQRLDLLWQSIREATGDEEAFDESMASFGEEFGLNPSTDLFPLLNGEWAIGLIAGQSGLLAEELEIPLGFTVVAATDQPLAMADTVEALRMGLEGQLLLVSEIESADITGYQVSLSESAPPAFDFGLEQGYFFIASSDGTAVETFAGGTPLAESDHFRNVQSEFDRDINVSLYLDVRSLLGTLRESKTGFDLLDFNESVQLLEPVEAVAVGSAFQGDLRRTQMIVFIDTD
ncbi:MAG: DUF3352 domain-containing protein, partial [Candidatus Promineifilaceae bacterium]